MPFAAVTFALAYGAGLLSTLSPCVLPLLPLLAAGALQRHRFGLVALAAGLALSFAAAGIFVATIGVSVGIDGGIVHRLAGALLIVFGLTMTVPAGQLAFARATSGLARHGQRALDRVEGRGVGGQLAVGAVLGLVWTPCVGPTLGAAATLASQGQDLLAVAALMLVFGIGAATPFVVFGVFLNRLALGSRRQWLLAAEPLRRAVGVVLIVAGALIVAGLDKAAESWLVEHSPDWLTALTTRF